MTDPGASWPLNLAAPGVRGLAPYEPGKPVAELERELGISDSVKLASNENPLGTSPVVIAAIQRALPELARYPDGNVFALRQALARRHGVSPASLTIGNGSNDVLAMLAEAFVTPADEVVFSEHAFAVYPIVTQAVGARARVARAHDGSNGPRYGHDLDAMRALVGARTRLVFIANPNNPTGTWLEASALNGFLASLPDHVIAVVDEAYFEFVEETDYPDCTGWLGAFPNLVVTRTFSKAFGLAGLRVGYGVSDPRIADLLNRVRQPFNVNSLAQAAALAALEDHGHLEAAIRLNREGMRQLEDGFRQQGLAFIPSVGNFVCVDTARAARPVYEALLRQGVIVRPVANYGLPHHLRVSVGTPGENRRFLDALRETLQGEPA